MRLRHRLILISVTLTCVSTLTIGAFAAGLSKQQALRDVEHDISRVAIGVEDAVVQGQDPLAAALAAAEESNTALGVAFDSGDSSPVWLRTTTAGSYPSGPAAALDFSDRTTPMAGYSIREVPLDGGATVVIVAWTQPILDQHDTNVRSILTYWVPFNVTLVLVIVLLIRRTTRSLEILANAASSEHQVQQSFHTAKKAGREERELVGALNRMLAVERDALNKEKQVNEQLRGFLGDASHELRTPLTVLSGYLELLSQRPRDSEETMWLTRMTHEAARLRSLVDDLLTLDRMRSGTSERTHEPLDLAALGEEFARDLRAVQPGREIRTELDPAIALADPEILQHAIGNILSNILRHTPDASAVRVTTMDTGTGTVQFLVDDGGPGLTDEQMAKGIAAFRRYDKSRSRTSGGSGLGLSILRSAVESLDGDVKLERSDLGGLRMILTLPAWPA